MFCTPLDLFTPLSTYAHAAKVLMMFLMMAGPAILRGRSQIELLAPVPCAGYMLDNTRFAPRRCRYEAVPIGFQLPKVDPTLFERPRRSKRSSSRRSISGTFAHRATCLLILKGTETAKNRGEASSSGNLGPQELELRPMQSKPLEEPHPMGTRHER